MKKLHVYDGDGILALVDIQRYNTFVAEEWTLRQAGCLYLVTYTDLTMAAQFSDQTLPGYGHENLFIEPDNGLYGLTVRQLFDPDRYDFERTDEALFEIVAVPVAADKTDNSIQEIFWWNMD